MDKLKPVLVFLCFMVLASLAAAKDEEQKPKPPKEKAFAVKMGYFSSNESELVEGQHDLSFDNSYAIAAEYYKVWRKDIAISVSVFYSEPDLTGRVWDDFTNSWVPASAEVNVRQIAVNYIRFGNSVAMGLDEYEGGFYGFGVGFSDYSVDNNLLKGAGGTIINQGIFEENSMDFNLILGYRFNNAFGVDAKWIVDEDALALFGSRWY